MVVELTACPICGNHSFSQHLICKDHLVSQEDFQLVKCNKCQFIFTNPRPPEEEIGDYYQSQQYISHTDKSNNPINTIYRIARYFTMRQKLKMINSIASGERLLDFGCGTGDFLSICRKNGFDVHGFEPDSGARSIAANKNQINIHHQMEDLQSLTDISIVTLWHVLEHVYHLNDTFIKIKNVLHKDGKIVIAVPNYDSYDAEVYQHHWAAYDVPRHLYHFNPQSMNNFIQKHHLKIIGIKPMKLDSFYVSLLSAKYRSGTQNILKSFITGYKSNTYAKNNNNSYSSLIYIVSK
jgi:2-polyprenyl-3-methyl-5-hydroxy-6-metoxy-1,4-benzoquinol methylase